MQQWCWAQIYDIYRVAFILYKSVQTRHTSLIQFNNSSILLSLFICRNYNHFKVRHVALARLAPTVKPPPPPSGEGIRAASPFVTPADSTTNYTTWVSINLRIQLAFVQYFHTKHVKCGQSKKEKKRKNWVEEKNRSGNWAEKSIFLFGTYTFLEHVKDYRVLLRKKQQHLSSFEC